jgi:hypothetical protein
MYSQAAQNKIVSKTAFNGEICAARDLKNAVNQISVSNKMLPWKTYVLILSCL